MSSNAVIQAENLSKCYHIYDKPRDRLLQMLARGRKKYYREFWALKDVSLSIEQGETVGIIGQNGSGKSTLLQMICGTVFPTAGNVRTHGRIAALLELGAGFNPEFTGRENVFLNASILGFPKEEMEARMEQVLEFSELGDFLDQPVKTYSSGMYSRLAFSTAIHIDPEILIVDEALAVGDARFVAKCMRRIRDIKEQGTSILFVSHDVGSIRTLCDRVVWLDKGHLVEQGDVFPITGRYMAYMFKDENSTKDAPKGDSDLQTIDAANKSTSILSSFPNLSNAAKAKGGPSESAPEIHLDPRPTIHWGSHKGLIVSASVCDTNGIRVDIHPWRSQLEVFIELQIPAQISREHLSVAFAIKDLKGTDLIVSTTYDFIPKRLPNSERFAVSFRFTNHLATGKYLLVAAVENRVHKDIHYYEYLEGAHYFSSLIDSQVFGLFQPIIEQQIMDN